MDNYRAYRIRVFGLTLVFYYDTVARGSTGIGAVLDLYRGQMRAFVAGFHLYLLQRRVGIELRRRYW